MSKISDKFNEKLIKLAEDAEEKLEDVILLFEIYKQTIKKLTPYKLTDTKLEKRAYEAIKEDYNQRKFKKAREQWFIPFGVFSETKDQNQVLRDEILKEWATPENRIKMIRGESGDGTDSKVMTMKVKDDEVDGTNILFEDVYKPVKNRTSLKLTEAGGVTIVVDGDLWTPTDKPIPRDYRRQLKYGDDFYDNRAYSRPLDPNWKVTLFGVGFFSGMKEVIIKDPETGEAEKIERPKNIFDDGFICKINFYREYANPNNPIFILNKPIFFNPCKLKATDTNFSDELFIQTNASKGLEITPMENFVGLSFVYRRKNPETGEVQEIKRDIVKEINKRIRIQAKKLKSFYDDRENFEKLPKEKQKLLEDLYNKFKKFLGLDYIPMIDLIEINKYHMTHRAIRDKDGNIVKSPKYEKGQIVEGVEGAWDQTDFNSFALSECSFTGTWKKNASSPPKMIITDASLPENVSLFTKFSNGIKASELPASRVLVSLTTSRGNQAYDEDTKKFILNPEEAVAIPKVKGIKVLLDFEALIRKVKEDLDKKNLKTDL